MPPAVVRLCAVCATSACRQSSARVLAAATSTPQFVVSPYKATYVKSDNNNVLQSSLNNPNLIQELKGLGGSALTLAFASGECDNANWSGVSNRDLANGNAKLFDQGGIQYILSTGGAGASFTCGSDSGFESFLAPWASAHLLGVDFDIENGQSYDQIYSIMQRVKSAHNNHPQLRFSFTVASIASSQQGQTSARSLGRGVGSPFGGGVGDTVMQIASSMFGYQQGNAGSWPSYMTMNLMTMDFASQGQASHDLCVIAYGNICQMGQSSIQAAINLHDHYALPYAYIEITPMLGGNDSPDEVFSLGDAVAVINFVTANRLAGVHWWEYDRDSPSAAGAASISANSLPSRNIAFSPIATRGK
jgi:chitinase